MLSLKKMKKKRWRREWQNEMARQNQDWPNRQLSPQLVTPAVTPHDGRSPSTALSAPGPYVELYLQLIISTDHCALN